MPVDTRAPGPVAEGDGAIRLVGSQCAGCATTSFPSQPRCSRCGSSMHDIELPADGTVWSWTVQRISPKPPYAGPQPFEPFAVGYVDLGALKVESPLFGHPVDEWQIGEQVELRRGPDHPNLQFWFEPKAATR